MADQTKQLSDLTHRRMDSEQQVRDLQATRGTVEAEPEADEIRCGPNSEHVGRGVENDRRGQNQENSRGRQTDARESPPESVEDHSAQKTNVNAQASGADGQRKAEKLE